MLFQEQIFKKQPYHIVIFSLCQYVPYYFNSFNPLLNIISLEIHVFEYIQFNTSPLFKSLFAFQNITVQITQFPDHFITSRRWPLPVRLYIQYQIRGHMMLAFISLQPIILQLIQRTTFPEYLVDILSAIMWTQTDTSSGILVLNFVLNIFQKHKNYIYIFFSTLKWYVSLEYFLVEDKDLFIPHGQYLGY